MALRDLLESAKPEANTMVKPSGTSRKGGLQGLIDISSAGAPAVSVEKKPVVPSVEFPNTEISQAPEKSLGQKIFDTVTAPFTNSAEDDVDRSQVITIVSKQTGASYDDVEKNLPAYTKALGLRSVPTTQEVVSAVSTLPIVAGLVSNPISVGLGIAAFEAMGAVERKINNGEELSTTLGRAINANEPTQGVLDLVELFLKGAALHGVYKAAPKVAETFTKDIIVKQNLAKTVTLDPAKIRDIFQTGTKMSEEELKLWTSLGRTGEQIKADIANGVTIEVPAEKIVTIVDKPYWAKIKSTLGIKASEPIITRTTGKIEATGGAKKTGIQGLLEAGQKQETVPAEVTLDKDFLTIRNEVAKTLPIATAEPTNIAVIEKLGEMQTKLAEYQNTNKTNPVFIQGATPEEPAVSVELVKYPDGKIATKIDANTPNFSFIRSFDESKLFPTEEAALAEAKKQVHEWVAETLATASDEQDAVAAKNIIEAFRTNKITAEPSAVSVEKTLYRGSNKVVTEENVKFDRVLQVENSQRELLTTLANEGDTRAAEILKSKDFYVEADRYLSDKYSGQYDAIQYNNADRPRVGTEYHDLSTGKFLAENKAVAELYAMQNRKGKYEAAEKPQAVEPKIREIILSKNATLEDGNAVAKKLGVSFDAKEKVISPVTGKVVGGFFYPPKTTEKGYKPGKIEVTIKDGKIDPDILFHEALHAHFSMVLNEAERAALLDSVEKSDITLKRRVVDFIAGYPKGELAEEWLADSFPRWLRNKNGDVPFKYASTEKAINEAGADKVFENLLAQIEEKQATGAKIEKPIKPQTVFTKNKEIVESYSSPEDFAKAVVYHGTNPDATPRILRNGFKGNTSFTYDFDTALSYTNEDGTEFFDFESTKENAKNIDRSNPKYHPEDVVAAVPRKGAENIGMDGVDKLTGEDIYKPEDVVVVGTGKQTPEQLQKFYEQNTSKPTVSISPEMKSAEVLKNQIGDIFEVAKPVGKLWKSKGDTLFIVPTRPRAGFIEWLKQKNFVANAEDAGGNNVVKVTLKSEVSAEKLPTDESEMIAHLKAKYPESITLYHQTSETAEGNIRKQGFIGDKNDNVFFSVEKYDKGRGTASDNAKVIAIKLKPEDYDKIFPDEGSYFGTDNNAIIADMFKSGFVGADVTLPAEIASKYAKTATELTLKPTEKKTPEDQKTEFKDIFGKDSLVGNLKTPYNGTALDKTDVKKLLKASDEFADNPVLIVDADKNLTFTGAKQSFKIKAEALGLNAEKLTEGDRISVDVKALNATGAEKQLRVYKGGSAYASLGTFSDGTPVEMGSLESIKPIEMPELVRLARQLMGTLPSVKRKIGDKYGVFYPRGNGDIKLRADLFKQGNEEQVAKTLAHEIGHLTDYLPDKTMKRGNLIGRLFTLRRFIASTFDKVEGEALDLKKIRNDAFRQVLREENVKFSEYITTPEVREQMKPLIKARYQKLVDETGAIQNEAVKKELTAVTDFWRPYDKQKSSPNYLRYRAKPSEMYADAISMLFNSPGTLEKMAPTFYKEFFGALDNKPEVKAAYFELQELLNGSTEAIFKARKEDIRTGFERAEAIQKDFDAKKKLANLAWWERLRQQLDDVNYPILRRQRVAEAAGQTFAPEENPKFLLQEQSMADNENFLLVNDLDTSIVKPLEAAGMTVDDFGEYLMLDRIQKDRADIANPLGLNPKTAAQQLDSLKAEVGEENFALLQEKATYFHEQVFKSVEEAVRVGSYNKELFETKIKPNKGSHASFRVVDYMQDFMPATIKAQVGTLKEIANPFISTVLKTVALNRLNAYQRAKNSTIKLLTENFASDIKQTKRITTDGKLSIFKPEHGKGTIEVLEDGKMQSYDVDPYIADSFAKDKVGDLNMIVALMDQFNSKFFKPVVTTYNLGFAAGFNPVRDFKRNYKAIPNATVANLLTAYAQSLPSAVRYSRGKLDTLTRELVESKAINAPVNDYNFDPRDDEMGRILQRYHLIKSNDAPTNVFNKALQSKIMKPAIKTLEGIRFVANTLEIVSKIAGARVRIAGGESGKQLAYNLRNFTGTPNYKVRGLQTGTTNALFVFSNIMKEGLKSDYRIAVDPATRSGYWWKTVKADILPKALMFLASAGVLGVALKDFYDNVSEYDKTNYTIIPLGYYNEKAVYLRVPHDETGRLFAASFWKIANSIKDGGNTKDLQDIVALGAGQLPSITPFYTTTSGWLEYLSGKNPYDAFRGRNVVDDTTFAAGGGAALKKMVQWTTNTLGLTKFATFDTSKQTGLETAMQVAPWFSSIIKISNYGKQEQLKEIGAKVKQEEARTTLADRAVVEKYVLLARDSKSKLFEATKYRIPMIKEALGGHMPENKEEADHADRLVTRFKRALKVGLNDDPRVGAIISSTSNLQKLELLRAIQADMTPADFQTFKQGLVRDNIVPAALLSQLKQQK